MAAHEKFVIFEGIDGSGKRTLAQAFANELATREMDVFNLVHHCAKEKHIPTAEQISAQILMTTEPTWAWIGIAIREELIKKGQEHDALSIAHGYALDRMILYKRLVVPSLAAGKYVIQERGVPSSLVYQPIQKNPMTIEEVCAIPGNQIAILNAPGHIVVAKVSAKTAMTRLGARTEKNDNAIFEKESFLAKAAERYESEWFRNFWESRGTKVHYFDAAQPIETAKAAAAQLANEIFPA
jgi:thymidylate kinase